MGAYSCDVGAKRWDMKVKSSKFGGGSSVQRVGNGALVAEKR